MSDYLEVCEDAVRRAGTELLASTPTTKSQSTPGFIR